MQTLGNIAQTAILTNVRNLPNVLRRKRKHANRSIGMGLQTLPLSAVLPDGPRCHPENLIMMWVEVQVS